MENELLSKKLFKVFNEYFKGLKQAEIKEWEDSILSWQKDLKKSYKNVLKDGDTAYFRDRYLLKENWAISEAKHTNLPRKIKGTDPDKIFAKIKAMIAAGEKGSIQPNEVLSEGRILETLGPSTLTEILHKYFIQRFPIYNKRSSWGLMLAYDMGISIDEVLGMPYEQFIEHCDEVYGCLIEWADSKKLKLSEKFKYYYLDRLFLNIYESERCVELRKIYGSDPDKYYY